MSEQAVKRYDPEVIETKGSSRVMAVMTEDAHGDWVSGEDYDALLAENARLLSAGQALEADFSSYRREVEHKNDALQSRLSLDDYNGIRETMYLLGSSENAKRLRSSIAQLRSGKTITKELSNQ